MHAQTNISTAPPSLTDKLKQLEGYLSYFTSGEDGHLLQEDKKSEFHNILKFAKDVTESMKWHQRGKDGKYPNRMIGDFYNHEWSDEQGNNLFHFLNSLKGELDREISYEKPDDERVITKKLAYMNLEEMVAKFPVQFTPDDNAKLSGGAGTQQMTLAKNDFIINKLKKANYDVYIASVNAVTPLGTEPPKSFIPFSPEDGEIYIPTVMMQNFGQAMLEYDTDRYEFFHWSENEVSNPEFEKHIPQDLYAGDSRKFTYQGKTTIISTYDKLRGSIFLTDEEWERYGDTLRKCINDTREDTHQKDRVFKIVEQLQKAQNDGKWPNSVMFTGAGCEFHSIQLAIQEMATVLSGNNKDFKDVALFPQLYGKLLGMELNELGYSPIYSLDYLKDIATKKCMMLVSNGESARLYASAKQVGEVLLEQGTNSAIRQMGAFLVKKSNEYKNAYSKVPDAIKKQLRNNLAAIGEKVKPIDLLTALQQQNELTALQQHNEFNKGEPLRTLHDLFGASNVVENGDNIYHIWNPQSLLNLSVCGAATNLFNHDLIATIKEDNTLSILRRDGFWAKGLTEHQMERLNVKQNGSSNNYSPK